MADLRLDLSRVDADLEQDYDDAEEGFPVSPLDENLLDDTLTPLERLERFYATEEIFERDLAVREIPSVIDTIYNFPEFEKLCFIADKLAWDTEAVIRMSMLNNISSLLEKSSMLGYIEEELQRMQEGIMEIPIRMLRDVHDQVRRVAHICLVNLLEEEQAKELLLQLLCSAIVHLLTSEGNHDLRMDAISLISKISPFIGRDVMIKEFVPLFKGLSCDGMFHVRKAFAVCCKDICAVLDDDSAEEHVFPLFLNLCKDEVWGVRKACADVFTDVSYASIQSTRKEKLTPAFLLLLNDPSRWVRKAAYQSLGPFISTFYDPDAYYATEDYMEKASPDQSQVEDHCPEEDSERHKPLSTPPCTASSSSTSTLTDVKVECSNCARQMESVKIHVSSTEILESVEFSTFNFWRTPLPQIDSLDLEKLSLEEKTETVTTEKPTLHVHLSMSDSYMENDEEEGLSVLTQTSDTESDEGSDSPNFSLQEAANMADQLSKDGDAHDASADSENTLQIGHHGDDEAEDHRTSPILVSGVVTNELGEEIIEITEIDVHEDDAIGQQLSSLSNTTPSVSTANGNQLQFINNKIQSGWNTSPSSGDSQTDGGMISCLIPRVKITSHSDIPFSMGGIVTFDNHDNSNFELSGHLQRSSQVDMDITCTGSEESLASKQDVVPPELLDNYLSMVNQSKMVDSDLAFHCAFSFPAVALTLGAPHWPVVSILYKQLSCDIQWKIRRSLAFSIHEVARIIGPEATCSELLGIFEDFLKDIDEVRVGVLTHLADFLEVLPAEQRQRYIVILKDFMTIDNERNWRFRHLLIGQLMCLCDLYSVQPLVEHVVPIALHLAKNRVSEVRVSAHDLFGIIIVKLEQLKEHALCQNLLRTMCKDFASSNQWKLRAEFVNSCANLLSEEKLSPEVFAKELLEPVILLVSDPISNVRVAVAKILKQVIIANDYFLRNDNRLGLSCGSLFPVLETLQHDTDRDVRFFSGGEREPEIHTERRFSNNIEEFQDPFELELRDRSFSEVERVIYGQQQLEETTKPESTSATEDDDTLESNC